MAKAVLRLRQPRAFTVRKRNVGNTLSTGLVVRRSSQISSLPVAVRQAHKLLVALLIVREFFAPPSVSFRGRLMS